MTDMTQKSSFIKWAGGKTWLVPFVKSLIDGLEFNNYYELFMGSASMFFAIDPPNKSYLSDVNPELVGAFCAVRDNPQRVIDYLKEYKTDANSYYAIRDSEPRGKYQQAARFLYLNKYGFCGLYRVNSQGKYNVSYGQRGNTQIDYDRILECSKKLQGVEIVAQDFNASKTLIQKGDLVFLDPPYCVSEKHNPLFLGYNKIPFSLTDQYRLAELIDYIIEQRAFFILTNAIHDKIMEIFGSKGRFFIRDRNCSIGKRKGVKGKVQEYIFTNIVNDTLSF